MSDFKWRHYRGEIILSCVPWYCKYGISYRDLEGLYAQTGGIFPMSVETGKLGRIILAYKLNPLIFMLLNIENNSNLIDLESI